MITEHEVGRIIEETVRDQLAPLGVAVHVRPGTDEDGDPVLNIVVVIAGAENPDRQKMLGLARHIRSRIGQAAASGFPVLSFVSEHDAATMGLAAA